jgi:hypothetical protein
MASHRRDKKRLGARGFQIGDDFSKDGGIVGNSPASRRHRHLVSLIDSADYFRPLHFASYSIRQVVQNGSGKMLNGFDHSGNLHM